jgi:hypothetical protein
MSKVQRKNLIHFDMVLICKMKFSFFLLLFPANGTKNTEKQHTTKSDDKMTCECEMKC